MHKPKSPDGDYFCEEEFLFKEMTGQKLREGGLSLKLYLFSGGRRRGAGHTSGPGRSNGRTEESGIPEDPRPVE